MAILQPRSTPSVGVHHHLHLGVQLKEVYSFPFLILLLAHRKRDEKREDKKKRKSPSHSQVREDSNHVMTRRMSHAQELTTPKDKTVVDG
jgi:hypothetical protein